MNRNHFIIFFFASFLLWLVPFGLRLIFADESFLESNQVNSKGVVAEIMSAYTNNRRYDAFILIFGNNLKVTIINICGGVFLGLGTVVNLLMNGFYTADVFSSVYRAGMPVSEMLTYILPHSFEMIGIWMSGAIGFSLAKVFIDYIRFNTLPTSNFYKHIGTVIAISTVIIFLAAYVEAYITVPSN